MVEIGDLVGQLLAILSTVLDWMEGIQWGVNVGLDLAAHGLLQSYMGWVALVLTYYSISLVFGWRATRSQLSTSDVARADSAIWRFSCFFGAAVAWLSHYWWDFWLG